MSYHVYAECFAERLQNHPDWGRFYVWPLGVECHVCHDEICNFLSFHWVLKRKKERQSNYGHQQRKITSSVTAIGIRSRGNDPFRFSQNVDKGWLMRERRRKKSRRKLTMWRSRIGQTRRPKWDWSAEMSDAESVSRGERRCEEIESRIETCYAYSHSTAI